MKQLSKDLSRIFSAPAPKKPDTQRKHREEAKSLAQKHCIEIEALRPGFNVWPPASVADTDRDPFAGDHYADDWQEVAVMVKQYAAIA